MTGGEKTRGVGSRWFPPPHPTYRVPNTYSVDDGGILVGQEWGTEARAYFFRAQTSWRLEDTLSLFSTLCWTELSKRFPLPLLSPGFGCSVCV